MLFDAPEEALVGVFELAVCWLVLDVRLADAADAGDTVGCVSVVAFAPLFAGLVGVRTAWLPASGLALATCWVTGAVDVGASVAANACWFVKIRLASSVAAMPVTRCHFGGFAIIIFCLFKIMTLLFDDKNSIRLNCSTAQNNGLSADKHGKTRFNLKWSCKIDGQYMDKTGIL
ncbi:hypothetical protein AWA1501_30550 [Lactiplantibacillus pentosus]|nr:hypothetical protein AWA1501_30550 [Lactiplantibacillus pentosus]